MVALASRVRARDAAQHPTMHRLALLPSPTKNDPTQMEITLRLKNPGPHNNHNNSRGRETIATVRIFITNFKLSMKGMKDSHRKKHKISTNNY